MTTRCRRHPPRSEPQPRSKPFDDVTARINAHVDTALVAIRQTTEKLRLQRNVVASSRRAFELSERQLRAGTADIVTVLNTQLTLFQAEDSLAQAQLARLQAIVSLYQALGGGWSPRIVEAVDAL